MKKFNLKLFLFLLPFLLAFIAIEIFYQFTPNNYSLKYEQLNNRSAHIEVLLFGDSHCLYGLNPKYFSKPTFNLSNVSQTIFFDQLVFEQNLPKLPNLKQVVFCIEYTNLSQVDDTGDDPWRKFYYQKFMNLEVPTIAPLDPRKYSLTLVQSLPRTKKLINRYLTEGSILDCDISGWGNNYKKENRMAPWKVAQERAKIQEDGLMDFEINKERMQQIINRCKARNLQILIVSMPQTKIYERYLNPKKLKAIQKTCAEFEKQNPNTAFYLNLFSDQRFLDEDFYDADHLNDAGAAKCSKIVNDYLLAIGN